jgi:hypothetical protein
VDGAAGSMRDKSPAPPATNKVRSMNSTVQQ